MTSHSLVEEKYSKGLIGLQNIGNTCYMNSVIQCLSNTKQLLEYVIKEEYHNDIKDVSKSLLIKRYADLIQSIWGDQRALLTTHHFKSAITIYAPRFSGYNQHDSQEFFRYLLAGLHDELNHACHARPSIPHQIKEVNKHSNNSLSAEESWHKYLQTDNSKIVHIFGGLLKSILICTTCRFTSTVFEPFWDLSLPIPTNIGRYSFQQFNLNQCLDLFTKEEILDGNDRPTCSRCKSKQICTKRILIEKIPQVLVIHLKRFSNDGIPFKVDTYIDYPVDRLNITNYVAENQHQSTVYNLYGVINHSGTCQFGHYTASCKHPYSGLWHHFNDSIVTLISPDQTKRMEAYILFYERDVTNK